MLLPVFGSLMSRVAPRINFHNDGTDEAPKFAPETAASRFRYATAFALSSSAISSAHSVEPTRPYSSASQLQRMIVRRGFQPFFNNSPNPRPTSNIADEPLFGSTAPNTHASRWFPRTTHRSFSSFPSMRATTFQIVRSL